MLKKVLVLSNMYPSHLSKTFGIFVKNQVELLRKKGLDVDVIAIRDPRKQKGTLLKKYGKFFLQNLWNLIVRGRKYDAVHVHYIFPTGLVGLLYKKWFGKKLIVTSHGGDIDQMSKKSPFVQKQTKKILEAADHVIAVGEGLKKDIKENFSIPDEKISVINMGVNREIFYEQDNEKLREKLGIAPEEKVILFVGNLIRAKGLDDLLAACEKMSMEEENISLHLIGEAKDKIYIQELKNRVDKLKNAVIHDAVGQLEIAEWMNAADLFILPSHMEGFGLVALEAMACGLPVVGTDVGGLKFLLDGNAGMKVEPHNPEELAEKALEVLRNPQIQKELKENGLKKANQYDQHRLVDRVISLY